jgi:hypothetical protein
MISELGRRWHQTDALSNRAACSLLSQGQRGPGYGHSSSAAMYRGVRLVPPQEQIEARNDKVKQPRYVDFGLVVCWSVLALQQQDPHELDREHAYSSWRANSIVDERLAPPCHGCHLDKQRVTWITFAQQMHRPNVFQIRLTHWARQSPPLHPTAQPLPRVACVASCRVVSNGAVSANLDQIQSGDQAATRPTLRRWIMPRMSCRSHLKSSARRRSTFLASPASMPLTDVTASKHRRRMAPHVSP